MEVRKTSKQKKKLYSLNKAKKVYFDISISVLEDLILLFFSENDNITKKLFRTLYDFILKIDIESYKDEERMLRLFLIKKLVIGVKKRGIDDIDSIIDDLSENQNFEKFVDIINELKEIELSDNDIDRTKQYMIDRIQYSYIYQNNKQLLDVASKFESKTFSSLPDMVKEYSSIIEYLHLQHRKFSYSKYEEKDFSFDEEEELESAIDDSIRLAKSKKGTIRTGLQILNNVLNGGFKSKNLYTFFAVPGTWKSGLLLNCALWGIKYNRDILGKDKTKKPTILYLTLENDLEETIERIYSYIKGDDAELKDTTTAKIHTLIKDKIIEDGNVTIAVKYRPSNTISCEDIRGMMDSLAEEQGKEVIMVVVDYIRRMKASDSTVSDPYLKLGIITDDLSIMAKDYEIPIVTASQLNRKADEIIDGAFSSKKVDIGKLLGRSMVSDSRQILDNIDRAFVINKEDIVSTDTTYLTFKDIKSRKKRGKSGATYFAIPFKKGYGMRLREDINKKKPVHLFKLGDDLSEFSENKSKRRQAIPKEEKKKKGDLDDLFDGYELN